MDFALRLLAEYRQQALQPEPEASAADTLTAAPPSIPCDVCDKLFCSLNAMRIHCKLQHGYLPLHTKAPVAFDAVLHSVQGMPECRLCGRKFFRWQQLQKHITEGACEALGGESFIRNPIPEDAGTALPTAVTTVVSQEAAASDAKQAAVPLVQQPEFLQALPNWASWPLRPGARKQLLEHCVLCGMWIASPKHVKQHMNKAHKHELQDRPQRSLLLCRTFKSQLTRGSACLFCRSKVGAPGRHAEQCTVLYQLTMATLFAQDSLQKDGICRSEPGGRHLPILLPERGPSDLAVLRTSAATADTSENQETTPGAATAATLAGAVISGISADVSAAAPRGPRSASPGQQDSATARGLHPADHAGQRLYALLSGGPAQPAAIHDGNVQGVASQEGQGRAAADLAAANRTLRQRHQRDASANADNCGDRGGPSRTGSGPVDDGDGGVDLSALVHQGPQAGPGRVETGSSARSCGEAAQLDSRKHERRHHSILSQHSAAAQTGGSGGQLGRVQAGNQSARTGGRRHPRGSDYVHQLFGDGSHRHVHEAGDSPEGTSFPSAGADGVRQMRGAVPTDSAHAGQASESTPQPLPQLGFRNPGNMCYINSVLYCLWLVAHRTGHTQVLPEALRGLQAGRYSARQLLGFHLLGWPRPERQHDVCEFISFLIPKLTAAVITGRVELRQAGPEGVRIRADTSLQTCIILPAMPSRSHSLQDLLSFWHQQDEMHALTSDDSWIFVQLPRFAWQGGRARKVTHTYHIVDTLKVPIYVDDHSLLVRWVSYSLTGIIQHHGTSPAAGHYTVVHTGARRHWLIDDEKEPLALTTSMIRHVCANMYVLALTRCPCTDHSSSSEPPSILECHASADICANQRPPSRGDGLACGAALSSGIPTSADCGRHGITESDIPRPQSQSEDARAENGQSDLSRSQEQVQAAAGSKV